MVGVDTNMCCGTHVSNLSHLQAVKLLHTESKQGSTLLYFVSGSRVCNLLEKCYQSERALTKMLRCVSLFPSEPGNCRKAFLYTISCTCLLVLSSGPEEHLAAVKKLQEEGRASAKVCVFVCLCMCVYVCMVHGWSKLCVVPPM